MAEKSISEEAVFIAGFKEGYTIGRRQVEISNSDMETNGKSLYQQWRNRQPQFAGAVIPVTGLKQE